jgi:hypothetical protein
MNTTLRDKMKTLLEAEEEELTRALLEVRAVRASLMNGGAHAPPRTTKRAASKKHRAKRAAGAVSTRDAIRNVLKRANGALTVAEIDERMGKAKLGGAAARDPRARRNAIAASLSTWVKDGEVTQTEKPTPEGTRLAYAVAS